MTTRDQEINIQLNNTLLSPSRSFHCGFINSAWGNMLASGIYTGATREGIKRSTAWISISAAIALDCLGFTRRIAWVRIGLGCIRTKTTRAYDIWFPGMGGGLDIVLWFPLLTFHPGLSFIEIGSWLGPFSCTPILIFFDLLVHLVFVVPIWCNMCLLPLFTFFLSFLCWPHYV